MTPPNLDTLDFEGIDGADVEERESSYDRPAPKIPLRERGRRFLAWSVLLLFFPAMIFLWNEIRAVDTSVRKLERDVSRINGNVEVILNVMVPNRQKDKSATPAEDREKPEKSPRKSASVFLPH